MMDYIYVFFDDKIIQLILERKLHPSSDAIISPLVHWIVVDVQLHVAKSHA